MIDEHTGDELDDVDVIELVELARPRDAGECHGGHSPPALDEGQNWVEALETSAIEYGPEPEHALDGVADDEDILSPPHPSDPRHRPVADDGSGGRRGL